MFFRIRNETFSKINIEFFFKRMILLGRPIFPISSLLITFRWDI